MLSTTTSTIISPIVHLVVVANQQPLEVRLTESYRQMLLGANPQLSEKAMSYRIRAVAPSWLEETQRAIRESRAPSDSEVIGGGRWLSDAVANAAHDFFENTADLLPTEPYIYSSRQGDIVAEFKGTHGHLTAIVASTFVLLFAVIDGESYQRRVSESQSLREDVRRFTDALRSGRNETLDAAQ